MGAKDARGKLLASGQGDFTKSLRRAEDLKDAWDRCQTLAAIARHAPTDADVVRVANKSLKAAELAGNEYHSVAVSAWPIAALVERGKWMQAEVVIAEVLGDALTIEPAVSRMSALGLLWTAVWPMRSSATRETVLALLLESCALANSWKAGAMMQEIALVVAAEDVARAQAIIDLMRESTYKRKAQRRLDAGASETMRGFF